MFAALEYETNHGANTLQSFFDSSIPKLQHPQVQGWADELMSEREQLKKDNSNSIDRA
jgi:putative hydrolase of HD superfamily